MKLRLIYFKIFLLLLSFFFLSGCEESKWLSQKQSNLSESKSYLMQFSEVNFNNEALLNHLARYFKDLTELAYLLKNNDRAKSYWKSQPLVAQEFCQKYILPPEKIDSLINSCQGNLLPFGKINYCPDEINSFKPALDVIVSNSNQDFQDQFKKTSCVRK